VLGQIKPYVVATELKGGWPAFDSALNRVRCNNHANSVKITYVERERGIDFKLNQGTQKQKGSSRGPATTN